MICKFVEIRFWHLLCMAICMFVSIFHVLKWRKSVFGFFFRQQSCLFCFFRTFFICFSVHFSRGQKWATKSTPDTEDSHDFFFRLVLVRKVFFDSRLAFFVFSHLFMGFSVHFSRGQKWATKPIPDTEDSHDLFFQVSFGPKSHF